MSKFLHDNNNAKARAIPCVFSENSLAENIWELQKMLVTNICTFSLFCLFLFYFYTKNFCKAHKT